MSTTQRFLFVFGTRPEAIKMAPLIEVCRREPRVEVRVCVTGQHRTMLDQVLALFDLKPDYDLDLMRPEQDLTDITVGVLAGLGPVLEKERPTVVLVHGDTSTCLAATLAAYYRQVPIAHVEAGLRTGDKYNPYPEEMNRRLTDALSDFCFAPTELARRNLLREGIPDERIWVTGNTVVDAIQAVATRQSSPSEQRRLEKEFVRQHGVGLEGRVVLVTGHRRESFGAEMESTFRGLKRIAQRNPDVRIIYPVHLNPHVRQAVATVLQGQERVYLLEPLEYHQLVWLMGRSYMVITDSGGIQEEAPSLGKPVLVTRKKTERPEGVEAGVVRLVGTDEENVYREAQALLDDHAAYSAMASAVNPYGDGHASERILEALLTRSHK